MYSHIIFFLLAILQLFSIAYSQSLPSFLPIKEPFDNIEKIIETYNFKSFDLDKENKLYTNIDIDSNLVDTVNKIILAQDDLFVLKSNPYDILLIDNPNMNSVDGVAEKDYVIVEGDFKKDPKNYTIVISHELMHRYIGHIIEQDNDKKIEIMYKWFFEGFTEFYGAKALIDAKLINTDEYLKIVNITLQKYFNSPINKISFEKMDEKHLLSNNINMITYYQKGFILAMIIDEKLRERKYNLLNIVNKIISETTLKQVDFNTDLFTSYLREHLPESFIKKFVSSINNPSTLLTLLPHRLLNKNLTFQDTESHSDICFDLTKSLELRKIHEVKLNSDCYNRGLRDGQALKCYSMYFYNGSIKNGDIELKVLENEIPRIVHIKAGKTIKRIPVYN
ncbi:hypothetical protein TNCT_702221 [Trichonephila clavata]|uniref:Peptidase M61 catalytic domain-containing protein n=1 Tax=Trichonephila clavata TaxID=2740835 RepID=A0A8X6HMH6_TRICU|nr:hypothetical protein TNCT_702221 [Trichonephila clavata]